MVRRRSVLEEAPPRMVGDGMEAIPVRPDPEVEEEFRVVDMMKAISADEDSDKIRFQLYTAKTDNPTRPDAFCASYPSDTPLEVIQEDARFKHDGGNFVLFARKGNELFKKSLFKTTPPKEGEKPTLAVQPGPPLPVSSDPAMQRLAVTVEKRVLLDKLEDLIKGKTKEGGEGAIMALFLNNMMDMNRTMMELIMEKRAEAPPPKTSVQEMAELAKFLMDFSQGKLPTSEPESSLSSLVEKAIPLIVEMMRKQPAPPVYAPVPPGARAIPAPPPAAAPAPPQTPQAVAVGRILDEIRFCLAQPERERLYGHLTEYAENYLPGTVDEILSKGEEDFLKMMYAFDSSFQERESFFKNMYQYVIKEYGEPETQKMPEGELQ